MKRGNASESSDWARRPSAMFAAGVLGVTSLVTMGVSLSRQLESEPAPAQTQHIAADSASSETNAPARASAVRLIDVNAAGLSELDLLPGIGPALGQRIIDYRDEHGPFRRLEDLQKVSGIGPRTLEKMRPLISLGDGGYTSEN